MGQRSLPCRWDNIKQDPHADDQGSLCIDAELEKDVYVAVFINGLDTNASFILRIVKPRTLDDAVDDLPASSQQGGIRALWSSINDGRAWTLTHFSRPRY